MRDGLSLGEDLGQVLGAQHVPQGCSRQQTRRVAADRDVDIKGAKRPVDLKT